MRAGTPEARPLARRCAPPSANGSPEIQNRARQTALWRARTRVPRDPPSPEAQSACGLMRRVGELAELTGDEKGGALADVHRVVPDPLQAARRKQHSQPPLAQLRRRPELEHVVHNTPAGAVDQLVEVDERLGALEVAIGERIE